MTGGAVVAVLGLSLVASAFGPGCAASVDGSDRHLTADHSGPMPEAGRNRTIRYVALGDSYTAAPVAPATPSEEACFQSDTNFPRVIARTLRRTRLVDVSCSGASTRALTHAQGEDIPPQLDAVTRGTDLVTIGVGGNDEHLFRSWYVRCSRLAASDPTGAPCAEANGTADGDVLLDKVPQIRRNLVAAVKAVRFRAPHAVVILVTYPRILPRQGTCPRLVPFAAGDYPYINRIVTALNGAVTDAADRTGVGWVDVEHASRGHDVCSPSPWVNGTTGDQSRALLLHPFPEEQAAVARLVLRALG